MNVSRKLRVVTAICAVGLFLTGMAGARLFADTQATCNTSITEALQANRIVGSSQSYRRDSPNEYAVVRGYLDGGARPDPTNFSHMGKHLVFNKDVCLGLTTVTTTVTGTTTVTTTVTQPTTTTATTTTTTTTPPGSQVYSWGFNAPHCSGNVWARSSWLTPACSDPDWYTE